MKPSEILTKAKALIDRPEKWTKGYPSRSFDGKECSTWGDEAVCFCSIGAIWRADEVGGRSDPAWNILQEVIGGGSVAKWNDAPYRTHAEVMQAFDRAISLAKERGV